MDIHIKPERERRLLHRLQSLREMRQALRPAPFEGKEIEVERADGIFTATEVGHAKRGYALPKAKLARQRKIKDAVSRAQDRQASCWMPDCSRSASSHILMVDFDLKTGTDYSDDVILSTVDDPYPGPVPGLCDACVARGAKAMAEAVYNSKPQMKWGLKPRRWWVTFVDGSRIGGPCADISRLLAPNVTDVHEPA